MLTHLQYICFVPTERYGDRVYKCDLVNLHKPDQLAGHRFKELHISGVLDKDATRLRHFANWLRAREGQIAIFGQHEPKGNFQVTPTDVHGPKNHWGLYIKAEIKCVDDLRELAEKVLSIIDPEGYQGETEI
jgi:hypothetical protein